VQRLMDVPNEMNQEFDGTRFHRSAILTGRTRCVLLNQRIWEVE